MSTYFTNNHLREYRESKRWTQADLANAIDVTELTIRRWERGHVVPSAYHVKRLCTVFQATPEELGIAKIAITSNGEQTKKQLQQTQPANVLVDEPENQPSEHATLPTATMDRQREETPHEPQGNGFVSRDPVPRHYETGHIETSLAVKRRWLKPIFLACIVCFLVASGLLLTFFSIHTQNAQTTKNKHTSPTAGQATLYRADWSRGFDSWSGFPLWQWSQLQGGMLTTTSTIPNNVLLAPYHLSVSSYEVEAQIQRIAYSGIQGQGQAFGIVVHLTNTAGYICGLGSHFKPEHFFIGQITPPSTNGPYYSITDRQASVAHLDTQWHTYNVIVTATYVSCLIDGKPLFSINAANNAVSDKVGIYIDTTAIAIKSFAVKGYSS